MTNETQYGLIEEKQIQPQFPIRRLLRVPHQQGSLIVTRDAFGPNTLNDNVREMQKAYWYPNTHQVVSFREPTTSESISVVAYDVPTFKKEILDPRWLQAGRIVRGTEGVWANPPRDEQGNLITDEAKLKTYLKGVKSVKVKNGKLYIVPNRTGLRDFGYAEYDALITKIQNSEIFTEGGLARLLEHTQGTATNLQTISSKENYKHGVNVLGFEPVSQPISTVVSLYSNKLIGGDGLDVYDGWDGGYYDGYAFGVLDESAEGASQK